ncbi:MAG: hypothetical protein HFG01_08490 [Oscillibacter sp.]|nr:hypothetical protein [Oscillibacter sp.]
MAVLALSFLKALSVHSAERLLFQEGYVEEPCIEQDVPAGISLSRCSA